ncbi:MAG: response regulator [Chloroflexota bacterium]
MAGERILVVDDEERIVKIVSAYLEREGYQVLAAYEGLTALETARREQPTLIILDLMLPGLSGLDVCRILRQESKVPIIMLTARDDDVDKIVGLELGADDYVTKPFNPKELVARVRAVLRRVTDSAPPSTVIVAGDLLIDPVRREVRRGGQAIPLTKTEFGLLHTLASSPGRVYTRLQLLEKVQGQAFEGYERAIDSHIKNLRQKVEPNPREPRYVLTVFGVGYRFAVPDSDRRASDA